jgi:hypothetical protein
MRQQTWEDRLRREALERLRWINDRQLERELWRALDAMLPRVFSA